MDYRRGVTTPSGREVVVRARRHIDADSVDPIAVPLPLVVIAAWTTWRELKNHVEYEHQWVVDVFPRFDPDKAETLAVVGKRAALDLVDQYAAELSTAP